MSDVTVSSTEEMLIITASGTLRTEDILRILDQHYPGLKAPRILWDLAAADVTALSQSDFARIAEVARLKLPFRGHRKTAYVVADPSAYLKQWGYIKEAMAARVGVEYAAFQEREKAVRWLLQ